MAQTYTRQSSFADGDTITAALFNNEFNQLVNAFSYSSTNEGTTGHRHDGTAGEGGNIHTIGDLDFLNKIVVDSTNNRWGFYVQVASSTVEQVRLQDGALIPVTDSDVDLGTSSLYFKDAYIDSVTTTGNVSVGGNLTVTGNATISGNLTFGDADTDSINLAAEIDSHIVPNTDDTYDLGTATKQWRNLYIDGIAEVDTLTINGTTVTSTATELNILDGVTSTADELNILDGVTSTTAEINLLDGVTSTTAELNILDGVTATSTEINTLNGITSTTAELNILDGVTSTAAEINLLGGVTSTTAELNILDGVTSTAAELNILGGKSFFDEDNLISNSATGIASQQSIKAYVDAQVTAQDLDFSGDSGGIRSIDLDSESLTIAGGTGLDTVGTSNTITVNIDSTVATLTGTQTLTNKTLTSPVINTGVSGTAFLDDDTFGTASASTLSSSESIKAYVDTTVAANNEVVEDTTPQLGGNLDLNSNDITGTGDINITGTIQSSGTITGTLATAAQTNITSLGTLTALTGGTGDLNWDSGTLFVDSSSNAVGIGNTNPSTALDVTGTITATTLAGTLSTAAQTNITSVGTLTSLGVDTTLTINNIASSSFGTIEISGTSGSFIDFKSPSSDDFDLRIITEGTGGIIDTGSGEVTIKRQGSTKLATTSTGIDVTGVITTDGLNTSADINFGDDDKAVFGAGSDLQIYHDSGSGNSVIKESGTGDLEILGANLYLKRETGLETYLFAQKNAGVTLYYDNSPKLATTSTGIDVTGVITTDGLTTSADINFGDNDKAIFGAGSDLQIYHDGSNSYIRDNGDGDLFIEASDNHYLRFINGEYAIVTTENAGVGLRYNNVEKIVTTDAGALIKEGLTVGSSNNDLGATAGNQLTPLTLRSDTNNTDSLLFTTERLADGSDWTTAAHKIQRKVDATKMGYIQFGSSGSDTITFGEDSTERMRIDGSGRLGLGTDSPSTKLTISASNSGGANNNTLRFVDTDLTTQANQSFGKIEFETKDTNNAGVNAFINAFSEGTGGTGALSFGTGSAGSTERMRIDSSGNVGIGTSSPDTLLHLSGSDTAIIRLENSDTSLTTNQIIGGLEFEKTDGSGAGAGVVGGLRMYSEGGVGESTYLTLSTSSSSNNNEEAVRIDSSGNVGIGTTAPNAQLHIGDANSEGDATNPALQIGGTTGYRLGLYTSSEGAVIENKNGDDGLQFRVKTAGEAMRIDSSGLIQAVSSITSDPTNTNAYFYNKSGVGPTLSGFQFSIRTGSTPDEAIRIDSSGNVGIGTSSVDRELHLKAANPRFRIEDSEGGYSEISANGGHLTLQADVGNTQSGSRIVYEIDGSEKMRIEAGGDVGIGIDNPTSLLHLSGASPMLRIDNTEETESGIQFRDSAATGSQLAEILYHAGDQALVFKNGTSSERARIDNAGNFLIGTTGSAIDSSNHGILLSNVGRIKNSVNVASAGTVTVMYGTAGEFRVKGDGDAENTNNSYGAVSDERLKENITDATPKLEELKQVQIKNYNLKAYPDRKQIGVVAQELEQVFPSLVTDNDDGYKTVKYSVFVPMLIKAMQEQQTQIEALQSEISKLKTGE